MTSTGCCVSCPPRWATPRDPDRPTIGGRIGKLAAALRTPLMPWQQLVADVGGEIDPATGLLWYREVVVTLMRQQGKTALQLPWMVDRCVSWPTPQHVTYAAQNGVAARDKLLDEHAPALLSSPLRSMVRIRKTSGHEALLWRNGSRHTLTAGKETSGHGGVLDGAVMDEAFAYPDSRLEQAFKPAMQTRPDPQLLITSTAGYDEVRSPYLWSKVSRGRARVEAGEPSRTAYFEWSFADDEDPLSPATWARRMPALGYTTSIEAVRADAESMELPEFLRAYGNAWGKIGSGRAIDVAVWDQRADVQAVLTGQVALAVAVRADREMSCLAAAGRTPGGLVVVDVIDHLPGTSWLPQRCADIARRHGAQFTVVDKGSPAGALIPDLEAAGVPLRLIGGTEWGQACGSLLDLIRDDGIRHLRQPTLDAAVAGVDTRQQADTRVWNRRAGGVDITPLEAVTLAAFAVPRAEPIDVTRSVW